MPDPTSREARTEARMKARAKAAVLRQFIDARRRAGCPAAGAFARTEVRPAAGPAKAPGVTPDAG
jgi:hypothetical protein